MKKLLLTILAAVALPLTAATAAPLGSAITKQIPAGGSAIFTFTTPVPAGYYHCQEQTQNVTFRAVSTDYAVVRDNPSKDPKDHAPIKPFTFDWAVMASNSPDKTGRLEFKVYPEGKKAATVKIQCWGKSQSEAAIPYKCGNPPNIPPTCKKPGN